MRTPRTFFATRLLTSTVAALLLTSAARVAAAPITGELSINGDDSYSAAAITFTGLGNIGGSSGSFAELALCDSCVALVGTLTPATASGTTLFTATDAGSAASLVLEGLPDFSFATNPNPNLDRLAVTGAGVLNLTGFDATPGAFVLDTQGPTNADVTFSATSAAVPAPPIGRGLGALAVVAVVFGSWSRRAAWCGVWRWRAMRILQDRSSS